MVSVTLWVVSFSSWVVSGHLRSFQLVSVNSSGFRFFLVLVGTNKTTRTTPNFHFITFFNWLWLASKMCWGQLVTGEAIQDVFYLQRKLKKKSLCFWAFRYSIELLNLAKNIIDWKEIKISFLLTMLKLSFLYRSNVYYE